MLQDRHVQIYMSRYYEVFNNMNDEIKTRYENEHLQYSLMFPDIFFFSPGLYFFLFFTAKYYRH